MVHVWITLRYFSSFKTTIVQSATSWLRVAREWDAEESHIGLYSIVMDGYIRGFIMEERATKTLIITQDLAIFFLKPWGAAASQAFLNKISIMNLNDYIHYSLITSYTALLLTQCGHTWTRTFTLSYF